MGSGSAEVGVVVWCGVYLMLYVICCFSVLGTSEEIGIKLCYVLFSDTLK